MEIDKIIKNLDEIGIDENQARVYLATLELGGEVASVIAKKADIPRVNTYYLLKQLIHLGLVYMSEHRGKMIFVAHNPNKLETMQKNKLEAIHSLIPELKSIENSSGYKPKIRFYEGIEGIKQIFGETLNLPKGTETLAYSSAESIHEYLKDFVPKYLKQRVAAGIKQRAIAEDSPEAREHQKNDDAELRETRLVPKDKFPFKNEINIFGNKIMIASYRDLIGVVIESNDVANTQRAIFELAWLGAKEVEK